MTDLAGFDACLAIGANGLGQALQGQIQPAARNALRGMLLPLTNAPTSTLDVTANVSPSVSIDGGAASPTDRRVSITLSGSGDLRMGVNGTTLVSLPVGGGTLPGALNNVPISVTVPISATLTMAIGAGAGTQVIIGDPVAVTVQTPGFPPANLETTIANDLTAALTAIIAGTGATIQAAQVTNTAHILAGEIQGAVAGIVQRRLQALFPLPILFSRRPVDLNAFCGIGIHGAQVALLRPGASTDACLAIATTLLPTSSGTIGTLASPLPTGQEAGLFFSNLFLISAVCCGIRGLPQFSGLPAPTTSPTETDLRCAWTGLNVPQAINGHVFQLHDVSVRIDGTDPANKTFVLDMSMTTDGFGWDADVMATVTIGLSIESGEVVPHVIGQPVVTVIVHVAWWVVLIEILIIAVVALIFGLVGGLVGFIIAGFTFGAGAIIGAAIGVAIAIILGAIVAIAINSAISNAASATVRGALGTLGQGLAALNVIPDELQQVFGRLEIATLTFDDVRALGRMIVPPPVDEHVLIDIRDIVLHPGEGIDLDRAAIVNPADPGCDLAWRAGRGMYEPPAVFELNVQQEDVGRLVGKPAIRIPNRPLPPIFVPPSLVATPPAALASIAGLSYAGVHLATVRRLAFPTVGGSVASANIPLDSIEPLRPFVLGARTGEGRYAKCSVWQAPDGNLHLRYTLWDTAAPLRVLETWTMLRGGSVPSTVPDRVAYAVSRTGVFHAVPLLLHHSMSYVWEWNGTPLADGDGPLAGGLLRVFIDGDRCVLHTAMGDNLVGELCVLAADAYGVQINVCRLVMHSGVVYESILPVVPTGDLDLRAQLELWRKIHGGDPAPDALASNFFTAGVAARTTPAQSAPSLVEQFEASLTAMAAGRG